MFKQIEYSEILFKNSLLNFGRCAHDGSLTVNVSVDSEQLIIFFSISKNHFSIMLIDNLVVFTFLS